MSREKATVIQAVRSWLGIPYAAAERFHHPILLPFNPDLPYDQKGPAPLQAGDTSWLEADNDLSEDCLNLNVWAPQGAGDEPLPVIVYIFGGGFELGSKTQTTSNLSELAATRRAIGVSLNYRLGPFGWLSLSQYGGEFADATNLGLPALRSLTPLPAATPTCSAWALSKEHTRYTVPRCTALSANNAPDKAMSKPPVTPLSATPSSTSPQATTTGFGTL